MWVAFIGASLGASGFWGLVVVGIFRAIFDVTDDEAMLFVFLPTSVCFCAFFYFVRIKLMRALGFDYESFR
jgi:hypothetical protein